MKQSILISAFLLIAISACDGRPKIQFQRINHDFGFVRQQEELTTVFAFKNTGTSSLNIKKVRAG